MAGRRLLETALRVPPLFVVDELLKIGFSSPSLFPASSQDGDPFDNLTSSSSSPSSYDVDDVRATFAALFKCALSVLGCVLALSIFSLRTKHLVIVYVYLSSIAAVFVSYWTNVATVKRVLAFATNSNGSTSTSLLESALALDLTTVFAPQGPGTIVIQNYVLQVIMSVVFYATNLGPTHRCLQYLLPSSFALPSILAALPVSENVLHQSPVFASLLPLAIIKFTLWCSFVDVTRVVYRSFTKAKDFAQNFGISALIEAEWIRLNVPNVLRMFWIVRIIEHAILIFVDNSELSEESIKISTLLAFQSLASMTKSLLITGCETATAVLGMTSVISFFCHYIGTFFQWVLLTEDEDERNIGTVSAVLFYILALQTGLTSLNPEKRFIRLCRNFCLLFAALLHFVHNIVNPILMSLSASHNPHTHKHVRALCVCAFLVIFPIGLLFYLWSNHTLSTWLLAVSAFSIEVIVKVLVSLMIYSLFLIDAYRTTFWEKLDDYVYYIRAFGNTVEFCFGIFLFFNGFWILIYESGGAIRACMMSIHAYFNIWCEAKAGWTVFMKRRSAVNKINSLPEASASQLESLDDVCAICYQKMTSAKITRCKHFFHGVCLRKWLYVQDRCPLCHDILYKLDNDSKDESTSEVDNVNNENIEEDQALADLVENVR